MKPTGYVFESIQCVEEKAEESESQIENTNRKHTKWDINSSFDPPGRWCQLITVGISTILAMSTWFSAGVILPQLADIFDIEETLLILLTVSVNIGFVIMASLLSILSLADMMSSKYWIILGCFLASLFNLMVIFVTNINISLCIFLRIFTGASMAMIYPPSVKIISSWFKYNRGFAVGVVIGALTLGTALPNLVNGLNEIFKLNWKYVIITTSCLSLFAGFIPIFFLKNGPYSTLKSPFDSSQIIKCFQNRELRLAMFGYFGHNLELYAMWAWIKTFFISYGISDQYASLIAFTSISSGSITCVIFGIIADKYYGRTKVILISLFISCSCCIIIGPITNYISHIFGIIISFLWGSSIICDSAQYSSIITEVCDQQYIATATTLSMSIGFTLTIISMFLIPICEPIFTWTWVYILLSPGPIISIYSIFKLRTCDNAYKIANGKM